jgi:hypothetical protein
LQQVYQLDHHTAAIASSTSLQVIATAQLSVKIQSAAKLPDGFLSLSLSLSLSVSLKASKIELLLRYARVCV